MSDRQRLERFLQRAFNGASREELEAFMHHDIEIVEANSLPFGGMHRGKTAYFNLVKQVFSSWKNVRVDMHQFIGENETVVALATLHAERDGKPFSMSIAEVWQFENGLIRRITPYYHDTAALSQSI